jgi:hypothetical protein
MKIYILIHLLKIGLDCKSLRKNTLFRKSLLKSSHRRRMIELQHLREGYVLFLSITFKECRAAIHEQELTSIPAFNDVLPMDSTHYIAELHDIGIIQCGTECSIHRPLCVGILYNHNLKSCKLIKSRLKSGDFNWSQIHVGWRVLEKPIGKAIV